MRIERKIYRKINGVPSVFGLPATLFLTVMAPLTVFVFFMGMVLGLYFSFLGILIVLFAYFFLRREVLNSGPHFFGLWLRSFSSRWRVIKRKRVSYRVWEKN